MLHNVSGKFPKDFLFGSASAAYQIEGAWDEGGKGPSIWDEYAQTPGNTYKDTNGNVAVDHYHRYKEDIALMGEMGLQAYRFSIAWSRIFPENMDEINPEGIQFYHDIIDECLKYGIEPIVTVYHWDLPKHLQDSYGGWESREIIDDYTKYSETLFKEYGDKVKYWVTINEQNNFTRSGWIKAEHPPKIENDEEKFYNVNHIVFLAQAKSVLNFHELVPDGKIGPSFAYHPTYAVDSKPENNLALYDYNDLINFWWLDVYAYGRYPAAGLKYLESKGIKLDIQDGDMELLKAGADKIDFMGVNYYRSDTVEYNPTSGIDGYGKDNYSGDKGTSTESGVAGIYKKVANPYLETTDWDWAIDPMGLRIVCREITSRYNLPILISENGLGAFDKLEEDGSVHDQYRIDYLNAHLEQVRYAIAEGSEVIAYCSWSFTDLLSWLNGYQKRYGFVYVDQHEEPDKGDLSRYKKDSYYWYQNVIKNHGIEMSETDE